MDTVEFFDMGAASELTKGAQYPATEDGIAGYLQE